MDLFSIALIFFTLSKRVIKGQKDIKFTGDERKKREVGVVERLSAWGLYIYNSVGGASIYENKSLTEFNAVCP